MNLHRTVGDTTSKLKFKAGVGLAALLATGGLGIGFATSAHATPTPASVTQPANGPDGATGAADSPNEATTPGVADAPGGPDVQSGAQQGPNDQSGSQTGVDTPGTAGA